MGVRRSGFIITCGWREREQRIPLSSQRLCHSEDQINVWNFGLGTAGHMMLIPTNINCQFDAPMCTTVVLLELPQRPPRDMQALKLSCEVGNKLLYRYPSGCGSFEGEERIFRTEDRRLCLNGTPWIWHLLEECVGNAWEYWSVVIGLISIVCFLFAALPQLYVAYQNGKVDQALSLGFLLCWIAGDLTSFIGCYLTNQLPIQHSYLFQIITPIFYINMDIIMISQFAYYKLNNQKATKCGINLKNCCVAWVLICIILCLILPSQLLLQNQVQSSLSGAREKSHGMIEMLGFVCGYISCLFYLGSRIPQLYKNFQRRSTEGTSYLLFALAMMGNFTYGLSLVLEMPATQYLVNLYFWHHLPWLIGSFGVLFLDIFITAQFILYRKQNKRRPSLVALEAEPLLINEDS
ncbi:lysosomal amino acid transporter 1 homolog isoform X3 [Rhineura floridana]|uniref:lysosomal amino acid transporter 1 homolog isoform X3 n=1 Tax=Rhineura floridana TaxID=261503 RepID=UPI002AC8091E|nr:lysosomal amino acid transporter 1 homolog isoform X3 [Rhineura floridana]